MSFLAFFYGSALANIGDDSLNGWRLWWIDSVLLHSARNTRSVALVALALVGKRMKAAAERCISVERNSRELYKELTVRKRSAKLWNRFFLYSGSSSRCLAWWKKPLYFPEWETLNRSTCRSHATWVWKLVIEKTFWGPCTSSLKSEVSAVIRTPAVESQLVSKLDCDHSSAVYRKRSIRCQAYWASRKGSLKSVDCELFYFKAWQATSLFMLLSTN